MFFTLPAQFSSILRSTFTIGKIYASKFNLLFHTKPKKMSEQCCLRPSHIASDFFLFISKPKNDETQQNLPFIVDLCRFPITCLLPVSVDCWRFVVVVFQRAYWHLSQAGHDQGPCLLFLFSS